MEKKADYINFPVQLLNGFLIDYRVCLANMLYYAIYTHSVDKLEFEGSYESAVKYFGCENNNAAKSKQKGEELYNSIPLKSPKVGLKLSTFWDYYKSEKSEFEIACLLGFLAIKSIVQNKAFCKITNLYWLSRMDGNTGTVEAEYELSDKVRKYALRYRSDKLKEELQDNWDLKYYSRHTRGFYVSFKLELDQLMYEAEKRRKSTIHKQREFEKKVALEKALERLKREAS